MARKRYSSEQIIGFLREAEILLAKGHTIGEVLPEDRCYRADLLPLASRFWKFECGSGEAVEGDGKGERQVEEAGG
jgi:hypothetical protein